MIRNRISKIKNYIHNDVKIPSMTKMYYYRPKNIPSELYHGTSMSRWRLINGHGLKKNIPKIYLKTQYEDNRVFLCSNPDDATFYGLKISEMEKRLSPNELKKFGLSKLKEGAIVISIDVTGLELKNLFLDPEDITNKGWFVYFGDISSRLIKKYGVSKMEFCDEGIRTKIFFDIEVGIAFTNKDEKKIVDLLELSIKKANELKIDYDVIEQIRCFKKYDEVATDIPFFPKIRKEIEKRGILSGSQIKNII